MRFRRIFLYFTCVVTVLTLLGCRPSETRSSQKVEVSPDITIVVESEDLGLDLARLVPDPYSILEELNFNYYSIADTCDTFCWMIDGKDVGKDSYETYRLAVRSYGWTRVDVSTDSLFMATQEIDGVSYQIELALLEGEDITSLSCCVYLTDSEARSSGDTDAQVGA